MLRSRATRFAVLGALAVVVLGGLPVAQSAEEGSTRVPGTIRDRRDVPEDRYALAGGCYAMRSLGADRFVARNADGFGAATDLGQAESFHFEPTDLGQYLLFGQAQDFLVASNGEVVMAPVASPAAEWVVDQLDGDAFTIRLASTGQTLTSTADGRLALVDGQAAGDAARFGFHLTEGCATFPDVEINVSGPHAAGETPYEEVRGFLEGHNHMMAFEFLGGGVHCGRPWHRYGVAYALVDCLDHQLLNGAGAVLENFLSTGNPLGSHDPVGWPTFNDWPAHGSLTHEQVYYRWLERAWRGGLRMHVNLFVDNRVLCEIYPLGDNSCDEMDGVRLQAQRLRELERYIDAQSGGPGEGWFRIVTDPFEARLVMNQGRLAVVMGIEVSEPFGCRLVLDLPQCTAEDVDRQLDEVYALGVRQMELVNKFDNALTGVAGDPGTNGLVVNLGNLYGTGGFWNMQTCDPGNTGVHDNDQITLPGGIADRDAIVGGIVGQLAPVVPLPLYPEPHHCNMRGLSPLGVHAIEGMIDRGMIFDPDHMSVLARHQSLDVIEAYGYSGLISSHSWATPDAYPRIYALGGITTPYAGGATGFVEAWRQRRDWADKRFYFGIGYGADANGFGSQAGPRGGENAVTYPFEGFGGAIIDRQVSGQRVFDINVDGVAHYGLYPDWIEDLRHLAGDEIVEDMARGPEAYLQMWERAIGIVGGDCAARDAFDGLRAGMTPEEVLAVAGQPERRTGTAFTYCVTGAGGQSAQRIIEFDDQGRLAPLVASAAAADPQAMPSPAQPVLPATGGTEPFVVAVGAALLTFAVGLQRSRRRPAAPAADRFATGGG